MAEATGADWSDREITAAVDLYLQLLDADILGQRVVKLHAYRDLVASELPARSVKALEYKLQNISAVFTELGLPYVTGLKPAANYQGKLIAAVSDALRGEQRDELVAGLVSAAAEDQRG